jgi:hypothetical protein
MKKAQQLLTESFTTKDGYLVWRQAWKLVYAELSADIRTIKLATKDRNRNPIVRWDEKSKAWVRARPWTEAEAKLQERAAAAEVRTETWSLKSLAELATQLLARRQWSKEEAQRQYQATKAVTV